VRVTDAELAALKMAVEPLDSTDAVYSDSVDQRPKTVQWPEQVAADAQEVEVKEEVVPVAPTTTTTTDADAAVPLARAANPVATTAAASVMKSSKRSNDRTHKPTHEPLTHTPKPTVAKTASPSKTHKPTHLESDDVKVKQRIGGVSTSDAKQGKFPAAVMGAVAKALDVSKEDILFLRWRFCTRTSCT
jgi:hypothetical protein